MDARDLIRLHRAGVSDRVIDYLAGMTDRLALADAPTAGLAYHALSDALGSALARVAAEAKAAAQAGAEAEAKAAG